MARRLTYTEWTRFVDHKVREAVNADREHGQPVRPDLQRSAVERRYRFLRR